MSSGGGLVKIAGIDKGRIAEFLDIEVSEEALREFRERRNGALLGVDIANDRDMRQRFVWEAGKEFAIADFGGLTMFMAGVFTPRDPTLRSVILAGDVFLEEVDDRRGEGNQILVKIAHRDEAPRVAKAIDSMDFPVKLQTSTQQAALDQAVADLDEMLRYAAHVIAAVALVIFVGLANATSMAVRERVREVGMLRSLGFRRRKVVGLVAAETLLLSLAGGLLGCGGAWALIAASGGTLHSGSYAFPVELPAWLAGAAVLAAGFVGLLGGLPAGVRASRRPIVAALRSVD
ncbi:MAG: ABC transporter permease [Planctomycetes bacterium]|jgi:putative ABC transport system permease protein|nr:ABC transporter permease [Planctomycetota bacterium]